MFATIAEAPIAPIRFLPSRVTEARSPLPAVANTRCSSCHLKELCLPGGLAGEDVARLDGLWFGRRKVASGQSLYREGDPFHFLYAVRSGSFKSALSLPDGREQVTALRMAGDLMALDGVAHGVHASTSIALEDAEVCAIPYSHLAQLAAHGGGMQHVVGRLMAREIVREHSLMLLLGSMDAQERLGAFLLNVSQRMRARGYSAREFHLRLSRADIGSYLGMKLETVSRMFSRFQRQGLLEVDKKHVRIVGIERLGATALDHRQPGPVARTLQCRHTLGAST